MPGQFPLVSGNLINLILDFWIRISSISMQFFDGDSDVVASKKSMQSDQRHEQINQHQIIPDVFTRLKEIPSEVHMRQRRVENLFTVGEEHTGGYEQRFQDAFAMPLPILRVSFFVLSTA
jgi:hypothetical protein